jgi:1-acyl-sn-glycerol-3-phosphate acyltransferase
MKPWHYQTADDLDRSLVERLRSFPRKPDMLVYGARLAASGLLRAWLRCYHRLSVVGRENLPKEGSYVVVANHASHLDALCLISALPLTRIHHIFPAAAEDYFFVSMPRTALAAVVVNALPFDREIHIRQSLTLCRELLQNPGNILILFPEGTRSMTGELGEFKPGIGLLLAETKCPVVPCYLDGTYRALKKGVWLPRPCKIRVLIGPARDYSHMKRGKSTALQISEDIRRGIGELGGKEAIGERGQGLGDREQG